MGFLKGSQMLHQNCKQSELYIFKNTAIDHFSYFLMSATLAQTKFLSTTNLLFSLSLPHALNKGIFHDITT